MWLRTYFICEKLIVGIAKLFNLVICPDLSKQFAVKCFEHKVLLCEGCQFGLPTKLIHFSLCNGCFGKLN